MKTAVIGAGRMGRRLIQVVLSMGLDLVGVSDINPESLATASSEHNIPQERLFQDANLLFEKKPQCVIVATTAPFHCEYTCLAAQSGAKFILCEKPMAVSLAECDRMLETCKQHGARLAINHQMRFMEQYTLPKQLVNSEAFGGLASVTMIGGNFGMAMNGSHYFEMFRFITGESPDEVTAWFNKDVVPNPRGAQFEDRAGTVRMTTPSGKRFYMEISSDQGHGMQVIYAARNGQIVVDELGGRMLASVRKEEHRSLPTTRYGMPWDEIDQKITPADAIAPSRAVLEALLNEADSPSGEDGRLAVASLVCAYLSDEQGHTPIKLAAAESAHARIFPWA